MDDLSRNLDMVTVNNDESQGARYVDLVEQAKDPERYFQLAQHNSWDRLSAIGSYIEDSGVLTKLRKTDPKVAKEIEDYFDDWSMYGPDKKELRLLIKIFGSKKKIPKNLLSTGEWDT
jgi:hypothetical protein